MLHEIQYFVMSRNMGARYCSPDGNPKTVYFANARASNAIGPCS